MTVNYSCLREKDVVNVCDGRKIGYICDVSVDCDCGRICAVFVSDRFFGFTAQHPPVKIPWDKIRCIGDDTVLVELPHDFCPSEPKCDDKKHKNFGKFFF